MKTYRTDKIGDGKLQGDAFLHVFQHTAYNTLARFNWLDTPRVGLRYLEIMQGPAVAPP